MATRQFSGTISRACWIFTSVVEVVGHSAPSSCVTFVRPLLNFSIHSYTLLHGRALSLYCVESLRWISAPGTPSEQRNRITALCFSLVHTASGAAMFTMKQKQKNDAIKVKLRSRDHSSTNSKHACAEGSVTNLKMCYGKSADNFLLSLV